MTPSDSDSILRFKPEVPETVLSFHQAAWKILIVDDDEEVHSVTRLVLRNKILLDRKLELLSAHSAAQAKAILMDDSDIAVILLDVVMETDNAGLELARWIRADLGNRNVRIILRTGQPGQAPEEDVITQYEINDYKEKTELTRGKLLSTIITALRGYKDLRTIEQSRQGMELILAAAPKLFKVQSSPLFARGILDRAVDLLRLDKQRTGQPINGFAAIPQGGSYEVVLGVGSFEKAQDLGWSELVQGLSGTGRSLLAEAMQGQTTRHEADTVVLHIGSGMTTACLVYLESSSGFTEIDLAILALFNTSAAAAFTNLELFKELEERLDEKSMLIREIHHRVKNNLQIILSLIDLSDPELDNQSLTGIRRRIGAMAVIHDRVSNLKSEKQIDFLECAPDIAADVAHVFSQGANIPTIVTESHNFVLPLETAVPCSLLIEELLTFAVQTRLAGSHIQLTLEGIAGQHRIQLRYVQAESMQNCADVELKLAQRLLEQLDGGVIHTECLDGNVTVLTCQF